MEYNRTLASRLEKGPENLHKMLTKGVYESDSTKKVENISWDEFEIAISNLKSLKRKKHDGASTKKKKICSWDEFEIAVRIVPHGIIGVSY